jgi:hypothetical protein
MISKGLSDILREYYVGKLATIITQPMALPMDAKTFPQWFTVMIDDIDQECILATDVQRKTKHVFFFGPQLLGIAEEQVISPEHPDYESIKKKMYEVQQQQKQDQTAIRQMSMPPEAPPQHTLQPVQVTPENNAAIEKITQQAAELKKKWQTTAIKGAKLNE